jgi:glycosyltransferase involved in cell wall biosynthesis
VTRVVAVSVDQLWRPQPGGIGTYVRGLAQGLAEVARERDLDLVALAPRGRAPDEAALAGPWRVRHAPLGPRALAEAWTYWPLAVPRDADVVHATSLAGPLRGGRATCSVAVHDLLWRDEPEASTPRGRRFHERRLRRLVAHRNVRIVTTSPTLAERLAGLGVDPARVHYARLGVSVAGAASEAEVSALLERHGVRSPFTLYAGTREPRKNLARLLEAHRRARVEEPGLGSLVLVGPPGWGRVDTTGATAVGSVSRALLEGLYRDAAVVAYVPLAEGWGLPPVEALAAGTAVVASAPTPSVAGRPVELCDPLDVASVADALVRAGRLGAHPASREHRRASVADLTWRQCALDHLAAWA